MKRSSMALAAAGGALALCAALGASAGTASADVGPKAWGSCAAGDVCVYTEFNGTGEKCSWDANDPNWLTAAGGTPKCSWAGTKNVKSIWNNGKRDTAYRHVKFYLGTNYTNYYGCAERYAAGVGWRGNTGPDAGAPIRSHKWVTSC
ncbi:peptidase inhibitor family I36 protein [Streptomyces sp. NPDC088387]|uniref:peptidase inhibitor family I36 protein n=1 Tax=Streptomyces sp. NPDC088387 TaxID=3365859 RepID=UPI0038243C3C